MKMIQVCTVVLCALAASVLAAPAPQLIQDQVSYDYARPTYTSSNAYTSNSGYQVEYKPQPYDFGYEVKDEYGSSQTRQESGDGSGAVKGSYGYTDPSGIYRQVDYIADELGYRVNVKTNEPGTSNQSPADVIIVAEEPPAGVLVQRVRPSSGQVVIQGAPRPTQVVGVRPQTVIGVRPGAVKVVSPAQHNIYTSPAQHNIYTSPPQHNIYTSPTQHSIYTAAAPVQHSIYSPVHHNIVSSSPVHHNLVPVASPVHVVHAAPSQAYYSAPTVVKAAVPSATHTVYKAPQGAAVVRSYGPF